MSLTRHVFGALPDGTPIDLYALSNRTGMRARIMTYGGTLVSLEAPDRHGNVADVLLGFDNLASYVGEHPYFGSLIGRYANRIARGLFHLDGETYQLAQNNGPNHLHGGPRGYHRAVWRAEAFDGADETRLKLLYVSPDGEEGYPATLHVAVTYTLTDRNELRLDYEAVTDRPTIVNLTNHAYFNLSGSDTVLKHEVSLAADRFLPVDETLIPTGEWRAVAGTPMDFTRPAAIGSRIRDEDAQVRLAGGGFDHNWILNGKAGDFSPAAEVSDPESGRVLTVSTTQPGLQFYTGNFLDGTLAGKGGRRYQKHGGFCLETQHFPDSPNHPDFPSTVLRPGETYRHTTAYRFKVRREPG